MTFWDVIVELDDADHRTVRGLTQAPRIELSAILEGAGLPATAVEYPENREPTDNSPAVRGGVSAG